MLPAALRRFLPLILSALLAGPASAEERLHVVVLHTNDVHGQVLTRKATWLDKQAPPEIGGLARLAAYVERERASAAASGTPLFVLDAGDWYQGTPEGIVDRGLAFVDALAAVGYDAMCVGNHEFDHGVANLVRILRATEAPAVCANLEERASGKPVDWVAPSRVVESRGVRLGVVGLVTTVTPEIVADPSIDELVFVDPVRSFARAREALAGRVDLVVPLTHCGVEVDRELARAHPELALIVGGHSHTYLKEGVREGSTLIVQAGSKASAVGRVDLWLDPRTKAVLESRARLVDLLEEPAPEHRRAEIERRCAELETKSAEAMAVVLGRLAAPAKRTKDPAASGSAGNLLADLMRERTKADLGLMNRGGIRTDLEAGPVTRRHVFEIMPFDNAVSVVSLRGKDFLAGVERAVEGKAHSGLEFSGCVIEVALDEQGGRHLAGIRVGGAPIEPERVYRVAMNSFMADGGDAYFETKSMVEREDDPILLRDLIELALVEKGTLTPSAENRYALVRKP